MLEFDRVVFFGRSWEESIAMYALDDDALSNRKILDCPSGPGGLVAGAIERGYDISGVDSQYTLSLDEIESKGISDIKSTLLIAEADPTLATSPEETAAFAKSKHDALASFLIAYKLHQSRFIAGSLPNLPFSDGEFDLVLSGHLLFVYAPLAEGGIMKNDSLNLVFHIAAARELIRVGMEVRIFPTYAFSGEIRRQPWVAPVMKALQDDGHTVDFLPSRWVQQGHWEFNDCLRIRR
jgi:SAM-dependent methyltransferase